MIRTYKRCKLTLTYTNSVDLAIKFNFNVYLLHFLTETPAQPSFNWFKAFYTAITNFNFNLDCIFNNWNKIMQWVWYFQGGSLPTNVIKEFFTRGFFTRVTIYSVKMQNAGKYTCIAYSGNTVSYNHSMTLAVVGKLDMTMLIYEFKRQYETRLKSQTKLNRHIVSHRPFE